MEDNLNIMSSERQQQYLGEWKTTLIFWKMEDDLNVLRNKRLPLSFVRLKIISCCLWGFGDIQTIIYN
jgi:hypothetical protein